MKDLNNILISVIVPVYNSEKYLDECVASITAQTHSRLEIILVDDGSTDNSPVICDVWAGRDPRIRVIHKTNGGASTARNAALDVATGDYIGFVDSDDTIDNDMFVTLLQFAVDEDLDFVSQRTAQRVDKHSCMRRVLDRNEAICLMLDSILPSGMPFKLVRREILPDVRFIEGYTNEDFAFSLDALEKTDRVGFLNKSMYHYRMHSDSVTHTINKRFFNQIYIYSLYKEALTSNPATADAAMRYEWRMTLHIAHVLRRTENAKKFADEYKLCKTFVRRNFWRLLRHPRMRWTTKVKAILNVI